MSKTAIIGIVVIAALVGLFGVYWYEDEVKGYPPPWQEQTANPASRNCVATLGGRLEIKDTPQGQIGICHLKDGRSCEEWGMFRDGVCKAGE